MLAVDTVFVRAPDLVVELAAADAMTIRARGEAFRVSPVALAVLDAFARPSTVKDALDRIAARGPEHLLEASTLVVLLASRNVLVAPDSPDAVAKAEGFVHPSIHVAMLDDVARTKGFCAAIRALVGPDDVVVDIGAGTGILSTTAALAGARRVYAIESSGIADLAERVYAANGVADRVTVVRGRSTAIDLPERGTVLVTETIGNEPLDERILEVVADARARLLVPGARIVPSAIEIVAVPVDIPAALHERRAFTSARLSAWKAEYGVDFGPLATAAAPAPFLVRTSAPTVVAPPVSLVTIDLATGDARTFEAVVELVLERAAERFGVALAFRATLGPGLVLSTVPGEVAASNHWRWQVWPAREAVRERGARVRVRYTYRRTTDVTIE